MKIGKFAQAHHLTIDSVRHYMEMGLLLPDKKGGQYHFDSQCSEDVQDIVELKKYGFTLSEIRGILYKKRLSTSIDYDKDRNYKAQYIRKHQQIQREIEQLKEMESKLQHRIEEISSTESSGTGHHGVNVNALSLLACPDCHQPLVLKKCQIVETQIQSGNLDCQCGRSIRIEDGILFSDKSKYGEYPFDDSIEQFFENTSPEFKYELAKGFRWLSNKFRNEIDANAVALELGVGYGIFLRNVYEALSEHNVYIAVDHNIQLLKELKEVLQGLEPSTMVILICADTLDLPLKPDIADFLIDVGGDATQNAQLLKEVDQYAKDRSALLGGYIVSDCPPHLTDIEEHIASVNYTVVEERSSQQVPRLEEDGTKIGEKNNVQIYAGFFKR
ncbi:MerR family transcriptional regulator [Paenibacillus sp. J5C_2022]|uniref:MerR family transcriptional regulator n=1 Tax=Paenibacillus sp. J5C2022 TaxID=2977129 RepID=UPI0021D39E76|nr:MerR family transcriptional regulator [Paenibacillus sp. J5C2022]MCU6710492.1 MerR family transcriptional regulator [Paenibacillus sp. J5C2022]